MIAGLIGPFLLVNKTFLPPKPNDKFWCIMKLGKRIRAVFKRHAKGHKIVWREGPYLFIRAKNHEYRFRVS